MARGSFSFDRFHLDPGDRLLRRDGVRVELNGRYLDALILLVDEAGKLVSKTRFMDEVWRGVPVTDEALTQCIRMLRRQLGDDAARPRFIETAPRHGYRFIAPVTRIEAGEATASRDAPVARTSRRDWRTFTAVGLAGAAGGGFAGILGGLFYGLVGVSEPLAPGMGAISVLLVLACLTMLVGAVGGAGVGFGIATAGLAPGRPGLRSTLGGAVGGLLVGAVVKLVGLDAFSLLFGRSPGEITGALEGALLGGAVGLAAWLGVRSAVPQRGVALGGLCGAAAGVVIALIGGRLMGGSLDLLADHFPGSRLQIDQMGRLLGEAGFGPVSRVVTSGGEGLLFAACITAAMIFARRSVGRPA